MRQQASIRSLVLVILVAAFLQGCTIPCCLTVSPSKGGTVFIGTPKVLTRETVLPDRNTEINFLDSILESAGLQTTPTFQGKTEEAVSWALQGYLSAKFDPLGAEYLKEQRKTAILDQQLLRKQKKAAAAKGETPPADGNTAPPASQAPADQNKDTNAPDTKSAGDTVPPADKDSDEDIYIKADASSILGSKPGTTDTTLTRVEMFEDTMAYRASIRAKKRDFILDEGHDRNGMTLYELKTAATFIPPKCADAFAVVDAWIEPSIKDKEGEPGKLIPEISEVYARQVVQKLKAAIYNEYLALIRESENCHFTDNNMYQYFTERQLQLLGGNNSSSGQLNTEKAPLMIPVEVTSWCESFTSKKKSNFAAQYIVDKYGDRFDSLFKLSAIPYEITDEEKNNMLFYLRIKDGKRLPLNAYMETLALIIDTHKKIVKNIDDINKSKTNSITNYDPIPTKNLDSYEIWLNNVSQSLLTAIPTPTTEDSYRSLIKNINIQQQHINSALRRQYSEYDCFKRLLDTDQNEISVIDVEPREYAQNISTLGSRQSTISLSLLLQAMATGNVTLDGGGKYARQDIALYEAIRRQPLALGYNNFKMAEIEKAGSKITEHRNGFGWILGPKFLIEDNEAKFLHTPVHHPLNLTIMVPAWITDFTINYTVQWIDKKTGEPVEKGRDNTIHSIPVRLPGDPVAVAYGLMEQETGDIPGPAVFTAEKDGLALQISSPNQSLLIRGANLWNSPSVIVGGVKASKVEILPDMHNLLATFGGNFPDIGEGKVDLAVVTTRGSVFVNDAVRIRPAGNAPAVQPFLTLDTKNPIIWDYNIKDSGTNFIFAIDQNAAPATMPELKPSISCPDLNYTMSAMNLERKNDKFVLGVKATPPTNNKLQNKIERFNIDIVANALLGPATYSVLKPGNKSVIVFADSKYLKVTNDNQSTKIDALRALTFNAKDITLDLEKKLFMEYYGINPDGDNTIMLTLTTKDDNFNHNITGTFAHKDSISISFNIDKTLIESLEKNMNNEKKTYQLKLQINTSNIPIEGAEITITPKS